MPDTFLAEFSIQIEPVTAEQRTPIWKRLDDPIKAHLRRYM